MQWHWSKRGRSRSAVLTAVAPAFPAANFSGVVILFRLPQLSTRFRLVPCRVSDTKNAAAPDSKNFFAKRGLKNVFVKLLELLNANCCTWTLHSFLMSLFYCFLFIYFLLLLDDKLLNSFLNVYFINHTKISKMCWKEQCKSGANNIYFILKSKNARTQVSLPVTLFGSLKLYSLRQLFQTFLFCQLITIWIYAIKSLSSYVNRTFCCELSINTLISGIRSCLFVFSLCFKLSVEKNERILEINAD